jgi:hypothetical protein
MADTKLTSLTELGTTPADGDLLYLVDVSDSTDSPQGTAKQVSFDDISEPATTHIADKENPHEVTKAQVGLGNVDNTSDATKNSATATLTNKTINASQLVDDSVTRAKMGTAALPPVLITLYENPAGASPGTSYVTVDQSKRTIPFDKLVVNASAAYFRVTGNNGASSQTGNIQLINVTDSNTAITGSELAMTATTATEHVSGDILANLPTAAKQIAYQWKISSGAIVAHQVTLEIHY